MLPPQPLKVHKTSRIPLLSFVFFEKSIVYHVIDNAAPNWQGSIHKSINQSRNFEAPTTRTDGAQCANHLHKRYFGLITGLVVVPISHLGSVEKALCTLGPLR